MLAEVSGSSTRRLPVYEVVGLPPSVRTALLPGQENSEFEMPLGEFVAEAVALLQAQPDAKEIQVERVKFRATGKARHDYEQVVETLNASDPHGNSQPLWPELSTNSVAGRFAQLQQAAHILGTYFDDMRQP